MPRAEHGYRRAFIEVFDGIILGSLINAFAGLGILPQSYFLYFKLLSFLGLIALILVMPYWGSGYMVGWLIGLYLMAKMGLIGPIEFIIYVGVPFIILIIRLKKKMERNFGYY